ncbi:helix-turn-helix domain-containing protein [Paenibacillus massiliensis]|uniref:helix-turn-helix domain-containing protein n=1 Tax=Paenibacillus massiliensis TaxID=225917 RepID=UPI00046EE251|nr:helix-turn-helix domain-containing protein [Paenibacillus massiliensis]
MNKFMLKIATFSLLLGAVPTIVIGIFLYYAAARDMEEKVNQSNVHLLNQTQMRVEQLLRSMENAALQFEKSTQFNTVMKQQLTSKDFVEVRKLMLEMFNLQSQAVLNQVQLINLEHEWKVDLYGLKQLEPGEAEQRWGDILSRKDNILWNTEPRTSAVAPTAALTATPTPTAYLSPSSGSDDLGTATQDISSSGVTSRNEPMTEPADPDEITVTASAPSDTLQLIHKIPLQPKRHTSPTGMLILEINKDELRSMLIPNHPLTRQFIINRQGEDLLSTDADAEEYGGINRRIAAEQARTAALHGTFLANIHGDEVRVIYNSSEYNGWSYVSLVSPKQVTEETRKMAVLTVTTCLLLLITVLAFALLGSRKMYRPIHRLFHAAMSLDRRSRDEHGKRRMDELDFIHSSLHFLARTNEELDQQMRAQVNYLREFYVLKLFTGQMSGEQEQGQAERYGFPSDWRRLGVLALEIDNLQKTRFQEEDRELLLFAISNIVAELLPERERFTPISVYQSQVTLLTSDSDDVAVCREQFLHSAERIREQVKHYLGLQVSIGISSSFSKLSDTVRAYEESTSALSLRFRLGADIVVHFEDVEKNGESQTAIYTHLRALEDRLIGFLREQRLEPAQEVFEQYLGEILGKGELLRQRHLLLLQLASKILKMVQEQGISILTVLESERTLKQLFRLQTKEEIVHWFHTKLFEPIRTVLSERTEGQFVNIAHKMVSIIHEQFDQDISLDYCATVMSFHPVYLSRVFKREVGSTFSEYLLAYRMNQAKVMLDTTDMKIAEIGNKVMYTNISAFIRAFRKAFGMTPGQYRDKGS